MSNDEQIRVENGCYVIPKKKLETFFKVLTAYMEVLNCLPAGEVQNAVKEKMKSNNVSEKDEKEFLLVVFDLVKVELTN